MKKKNVVTNTTVEARRNPMVPLAEAIVHGGSGSIEASEVRGQQELVHSNTLPSEMRGEDRAALEAAGVVFSKVVGGDTLFIQCTLPTGWTKKPTGHAMWSELLDEKGRKRASIFYKAAFYDRKAHLSVETRYHVEVDYQEASDPNNDKRQGHAKDRGGAVLFSTGWVARGNNYYVDTARDPVEAWLNENKPGWKDPTKYWDQP